MASQRLCAALPHERSSGDRPVIAHIRGRQCLRIRAPPRLCWERGSPRERTVSHSLSSVSHRGGEAPQLRDGVSVNSEGQLSGLWCRRGWCGNERGHGRGQQETTFTAVGFSSRPADSGERSILGRIAPQSLQIAPPSLASSNDRAHTSWPLL